MFGSEVNIFVAHKATLECLASIRSLLGCCYDLSRATSTLEEFKEVEASGRLFGAQLKRDVVCLKKEHGESIKAISVACAGQVDPFEFHRRVEPTAHEAVMELIADQFYCVWEEISELEGMSEGEAADIPLLHWVKYLRRFEKLSLSFKSVYSSLGLQLKQESAIAQRWVIARRTHSSEQDQADGKAERLDKAKVAEKLISMMNRGEAYTSQARLAASIGCSSSTVNGAVNGNDALKEWSERQRGSATGMQSIDGLVIDSTVQAIEVAPEDLLEANDTDKAMAYLMDQAGPEELEKIKELDPASRRRLAETAYRDPDRAEQIMRYRQAEVTRRNRQG